MFSIATTWNGELVDHSPVELKVSSENETSVRVDVAGPLFNDPGPPAVTSGSPCPELWEYEGYVASGNCNLGVRGVTQQSYHGALLSRPLWGVLPSMGFDLMSTHANTK